MFLMFFFYFKKLLLFKNIYNTLYILKILIKPMHGIHSAFCQFYVIVLKNKKDFSSCYYKRCIP